MLLASEPEKYAMAKTESSSDRRILYWFSILKVDWEKFLPDLFETLWDITNPTKIFENGHSFLAIVKCEIFQNNFLKMVYIHNNS